MAYTGGPNQFPVFLKAQMDGSTTVEVRKFEDFVTSGAKRAAKAVTDAGATADGAFSFRNAKKNIAEMRRELESLSRTAVTRLDSLQARAGAALHAGRQSRLGGGDRSQQLEAAQRAVNNLNNIMVQATANSGRFGSAAAGASDRASRGFHTAAAAAGAFQGALGGVASRLGFLGSLVDTLGIGKALIIGAAAGGAALLGAGKQLQNYQALLKSTTESEEEFAAAQAATSRIAAASRSSLEDVIRGYARLKVNTSELGLSAKDLEATLTTTLQAIQLSGAGAQEASAAMIQFAQALGNDRLAGDEFKSLGENASKVLRTIAAGIKQANLIDGFDGSISALRKLGSEGKLTAEVLIAAMKEMGPVIEAEMARMPVTISQAQTQLSNAFAEMGLSIERSLGIMSGAAQVISFFARNLGLLTAVVGGVAAAFITSMIPAMASAVIMAGRNVAAFVALTAQFGLFQSASLLAAGQAGFLARGLQFLLTPAGLAGAAIGAVTAAVIYFSSQAPRGGTAAQLIAEELGKLEAKANDAANAMYNAGEAARQLRLETARVREQDARTERDRLAGDVIQRVRGLTGAGVTKDKLAQILNAQQTFARTKNADILAAQLKSIGVRDIKLLEALRHFQAGQNATFRAEQELNDTIRDLNGPRGQAPRVARKTGGRTYGQLVADANAASTAADKISQARRRIAKQLKDLDAEFGGAKNITKLPADKQQEYVDRRAQIVQLGDAEVESIKASNRAASAARAAGSRAARTAAANDVQQMFADAKLAGEAGDALAEAKARYAAAMARIRGDLEEGLISPEAAKAQATAALIARNSAIDAAKAAEKLDEALQRMGQDFDGEPKWIDKIQRARDVIADARRKLDATGQATIGENVYTAADLDTFEQKVERSLIKPLIDAQKEMEKTIAIKKLVLAGDEQGAEFLDRALQILDEYGDLNAADLATVRKKLSGLYDQIDAEHQINRLLERRDRDIQRLVSTAEDLQEGLTGVIRDPFKGESYKNLWDSLIGGFKDNFAINLSTKIFGDLGGDIEEMLRRQQDPLGASADELTNSAIELHKSAAALERAAGTIAAGGQPSTAQPTAGQVAATPTAFGGVLRSVAGFVRGPVANVMNSVAGFFSNQGQQNPVARSVNVVGDIQIDLQKRLLQQQQQNPLINNPVAYYNALGAKVGSGVDKALGTGQFFTKIGGQLGKALQGAAIGQQVAGLAKMLGFKKFSTTGSTIGGIAGSLIGGPIGGLIGSVIGGIFGSLFKKTKKGSATIGADEFGNLDVTGTSGNSSKRKAASSRLANETIDAMEQLADQLGVILNAAAGSVSIGMRGDDYRVDTTGRGKTKKSRTVKDFGEDYQAAVEFAMRDLIQDGVLGPIRAGTKKLLLNSRTLEAGIAKALKFEDVFKRLKRFTDPMGAALDELNLEFDKLRRIFAEAGASAEEFAQLEQLYAYERNEAIKEAAKELNNTLQELLKDLTYSGDTGLSLRTRREKALQAIAPFQSQINSGQQVDQEAFAEAVRTLLEIEREMFGSTSQYFQTLGMLTALTQKAINNTGQPFTVPGIQTVTPGSAQVVGAGDVPYVLNPNPIGGGPAANDNAAGTGRIVSAIEQQTVALKASFLKREDYVDAIQTALINMNFSAGADGQEGGFTLKSFAQAVVVSNNEVVARLSELVGFAEEEAEDRILSLPRSMPYSYGGNRGGPAVVQQTSVWGSPSGSAFGGSGF